MEKLLNEWCNEAGPNVTFNFDQKASYNATESDPKKNPWLNELEKVLNEEWVEKI